MLTDIKWKTHQINKEMMLLNPNKSRYVIIKKTVSGSKMRSMDSVMSARF